MPPSVSTAARRAKRVVESASPSASSAVEDVEEDELDEESEDAAGSDDDFSAAPTPEPSAMKIKLRVAHGSTPTPTSTPPAGRSRRAAAVAATAANAASAAKDREGGNKRKRSAKESEDEEEEEEEEEDELDVEEEEDAEGEPEPTAEVDGASPSKLTARQRAKLDAELTPFLALPDGPAKPKAILTEAERLQKREEMARRRKRQNEQRLQDEQDQTINRLLRAQTGRSRSKLDNPSPMPDGGESGRASGVSSPTKRAATIADAVRYESRIEQNKLVLAVAVPVGREEWIAFGEEGEEKKESRNTKGNCAVPGCDQPRKYRCVAKFEVGGCSLEHLRQVEQSLRA